MHTTRFLQQLKTILHDYQDDQQQTVLMLQQKAQQLQTELQAWMDRAPNSVHATSLLAREIRYFHKKLLQLFRRWDKALNYQKNMQKIVLEYPQHLIILVYGKVNSGKTSLCNWLMHEFKEQKQRCFYLERGEIKDCKAPFTASALNDEPRIQGVELGERIVFIDAPGLHSTNMQQADMAKAVIAHSDAVLWLTPASAPGQGEELNDLAQLLRQAKPLLPIISCSDVFEESFDEATQTVKTQYRNKTQDERGIQENALRTRLKPIISRHIAPISVSLKMYEKSNDAAAAGLDELMQQLTILVEQASFYKLQKQQRNVEHFVQQRMLRDLQRLLNKGQSQLEKLVPQHQQDIQEQLQHLQYIITDDLEIFISRTVQQYQEDGNREAVLKETEYYLNQTLNQQLPQQMKLLMNVLPSCNLTLNPIGLSNYEPRYITIPQQHGQARVRFFTGLLAFIGGFTGFTLTDTLLSGAFTQNDHVHIHTWMNFLIAGLSSTLTTWWATTKLKYSSLTVSMVSEEVAPDGEKLSIGLQMHAKKILEQEIQHLEGLMVQESIKYLDYYAQFSCILKKWQGEST